MSTPSMSVMRDDSHMNNSILEGPRLGGPTQRLWTTPAQKIARLSAYEVAMWL